MTAAPKLVCIPGPTASGKSALAMALARRIGGEILCVDSMTVYRGMDIGTAKPTPADRVAVVHHGLDLVEPTDEYTVARFVSFADAVIADCRKRGVPLICVGGTPLYFMSLFRGMFDGPEADPALRAELRAAPPEQLWQELLRVDPVSAGRLHPNDAKRVIRAVEVFRLTGRPISQQQQEWASGRMRHAASWFAPAWDKPTLNRRINARVRQMVANGWVDEVARLPTQLSKTAGEAAGYRQLQRYLRGEQSLADAMEQIKISTRQLARRQIKWFRRWPEVCWLPGESGAEALADRVLRQLVG